VEADGVGVSQLVAAGGFPAQVVQRASVGFHLGREELEGHAFVESLVLRQPDFPHAPPAKALEQNEPSAANFLTSLQCAWFGHGTKLGGH